LTWTPRIHCIGTIMRRFDPGDEAASRFGGEGREHCRQRLLAALLVLAGVIHSNMAPAQVIFRDVTAESGVTFKHTDGSSGRHHIMETVTAGLALFDYDDDGDIDIYFINGAPLPGSKVKVTPANELYRNDGGWKFSNVTKEAGVRNTGFGLGVAVGDYDNDGDADIFVNNDGPDVLYRNNGDGTFTDVTKKAGLDGDESFAAGTCFLDMDGDGDLDLYVSNYLVYSEDLYGPRYMRGVPVYRDPRQYEACPDILFRNNGNGTFTDVSKESGISLKAGWGMGMVCADYDNDGDTDIFIANDESENFLFQNDGTGKFEEAGLIAGIGYDLHGDEHGSMGVDCGDYDNDGWLDFYVTSYQSQLATLYKNMGDGTFQDVTFLTGAGTGTFPNVTWGNTIADFDNDGDRDIFIACGHLQDNIEKYSDSSTYYQQNILLLNDGKGKFVDASNESGDGLLVKLSSRGAAFGDLDNDGDVDAVILNSREKPTLLRNESVNDNHWIEVRLRGVKSNRDGVGARVKVVAGDLTLIDEVHSGRGYQSHYGTRLHFGLGNRERVDKIEVRWIGGGVDIVENVAVDQLLTITEGQSGQAAEE
jgi:hypothetical protein